ncbi:hypothetical protein M747DRAFT_342792 [Aspergillus niger ATCC 13496]|uniref:Uncharacterized protein n=1 Tax=Aspergillus niger ATCC 13496 TaxID=1353008 RepID=A0A370BUI7_ASPNG|nr:hypothetical protein M747DRAFT_342792 [Aspergillus niger ATCC 13496]
MRRDQQSLLMLSHRRPRPKVNMKIATFEEPGKRIRWTGLQTVLKPTLLTFKILGFVIVMKVTMMMSIEILEDLEAEYWIGQAEAAQEARGLSWLAQQNLISPFASRGRGILEIHHDHEANIIYGGFGGMCTGCIRRGRWSLNSATVHRPVQVPYSVLFALLPRSRFSSPTARPLKIVWVGYHYGEVSEVGRDYVCTA